MPLPNPVVADSDGYCPTIFAADGTIVDIAHLTAAGVVLWTADDHVFLGDSSGSFSRDFTNSRVKMRNVGGVLYYEVGNASGDDTGGSGRWGGWAGTQADDFTFDALASNFTGAITVQNGKRLDGVVYTAKTTFSAASTVDIALPNSPAGVVAWEVDVFNLSVSADAQLQGRLSYDAGGTYKASGDYDSEVSYANSGGSFVPVFASAANQMVFTATEAMDAISARPAWLSLRILTPNSGTDATVLSGRLDCYNSGNNKPGTYLSHNQGIGGYGRATHFRLLPSTGTITGAYRVKPLYGFGAD